MRVGILKRAIKAFLYPKGVFLAVLSVCAVAFLVYTLSCKAPGEPISIFSYVLSAYSLTVFCLKTPQIIRSLKSFKENNKFIRCWFDNVHFRTTALLCVSLAANSAYAVFQFVLGVVHRSLWFCLLSGYYVLLVVIRSFLLNYIRKHRVGENVKTELEKCRFCGAVFLALNVVLSFIVFFMVYRNNTFFRSEITTITIAAYTFTALTVAIVNIAKQHRFDPPVYFALKVLSLAAASVSLLNLEATMLTTFNDGTMTLEFRQIMLGISGFAVSALIIGMAVYMIFGAGKRIKKLSVSCSEKE